MQRRTRILLVGADPELERLSAMAAHLQADVMLARVSPTADDLAAVEPPHVAVLSVASTELRSGHITNALKTFPPHAQIIVLAHEPTVPQTVDVMRAGAFALLEQPVTPHTLLPTLRHACEQYWRRAASLHEHQRSPEPRTTPPSVATASIIGRSRGIRVMLDTVQRVAPSDANCLIVGENGTGKELVADAIHASSHRAAGPFVKVNCAAIPSGLLESELFGHKRGAFTDAIADRQGLFERANGGSLFLDEIGEMPRFLQAKLLRVLQEREFRPLGANRAVASDIRLICATNVDIDKALQAGELREDLLFRINTITLRVPPLRERLEDLELLSAHFLEQFARRYERPMPQVSAPAMELMTRYSWPGNVRELEHVIERAVLLTSTDRIEPAVLPAEVRHGRAPAALATAPLMTLNEIERQALLTALEHANWNKQVAATTLGIYRATLYSKMRKYAIRDPSRS